MAAGWRAVRRFPRNQAGRDFVIGDVHGAFDLVLLAMEQVKFDPNKDRLFSVGDLLDRGAGSSRCRKFLQQSFVAAVRGNHEDMLLRLYMNGFPNPQMLKWMIERNGFGWWLSVDERERLAILEEVGKLPIAIEVETETGLIGIVHADVPKGMAWPTFVREIEEGDSKTIHKALWGRDRVRHKDASGIQGVVRVFVGHTPQPHGILRLGNVYVIDTGAIFAEISCEDKKGWNLSMINLVDSSLTTTNPKPLRMADVVAVGKSLVNFCCPQRWLGLVKE